MCWNSQLYILPCNVFVIQFTVFLEKREARVCRMPEKCKFPLWIQNTVHLHFFKGQKHDHYNVTVNTHDAPGLKQVTACSMFEKQKLTYNRISFLDDLKIEMWKKLF